MTFSSESIHTDNSLNSCDSSAIQRFITETRCNGSVDQCSMESMLSFSFLSENNATSHNLNNRLAMKTMAPSDSCGHSSPKLVILHKSSEAQTIIASLIPFSVQSLMIAHNWVILQNRITWLTMDCINNGVSHFSESYQTLNMHIVECWTVVTCLIGSTKPFT